MFFSGAPEGSTTTTTPEDVVGKALDLRKPLALRTHDETRRRETYGLGSALCPGFSKASFEPEYYALGLINWLHADNSTESPYLRAQFESLFLVVTVG
jgi:hypothetical protein